MKIKYVMDSYILDTIHQYISEIYVDAKPKELDRLLKITIEVYIYIRDKYKGCPLEIPSQSIRNKWRVRFNGEERIYTFLLDILSETELISRNHSYMSKKYSVETGKQPFYKSIHLYDIKDRIYGELTEVSLNMNRLYDEKERQSKEYWLNLYRDEAHIIEMIYSTYYDIDEVKEYLYSIKGTTTKKGKLIDDIKIMDYINRAIKYNNRIYSFTKTKEGRLYNPAAYQPSTIRHLLKMDGEYLVEMDVKNSQPLLLSLFIDHEEYRKATEAGIFYDIISNELGRDREKVKKSIMKYVFYGHKTLKSGVLYDAIEKHFSGFLSQLNELKRDNVLWSILQGAEADIFVKELRGNYISVHDGILIRKGDKQLFYNKIMNLYKDRNLKPTITIN